MCCTVHAVNNACTTHNSNGHTPLCPEQLRQKTMWSVKDQGGSLEDSQATAARSLCRCVVCSVGGCACVAASKDFLFVS